MISTKAGVSLETLEPPIRDNLLRMSYLWSAFFPTDPDGLTITSANDSTHGTNSLHYQGLAVDLRVKDVDVSICETRVTPALRLLLGSQFDVIFEGDHIHVEFDPKSRSQTVIAKIADLIRGTGGTG